jgi:DNA-binding NtrC family response regulator
MTNCRQQHRGGDDGDLTAVLVIEDDDRIRLSLALALEDEGYTVSGAATA